MDDFLMKPKIDFAFKEIMEDEKARIGFLSAVLNLNPKDIKETRILNPHLRKRHADDKLGILDVRILMNDDTEINTEIQLSELKIWTNRSLFYISKMYTEQIEEGQGYDVLKKCVSISILDFVLFEGEKDFYSCFHIREDTRHFLYTDKMAFHVIELPKLPEVLREDCSNIELWAKFISSEKKEELDMIAQRDPYIESAYQKLLIISQDKEKRLEYEAREKEIRDHNQFLFEAEQRGIQIGELRGIQIGELRGIQIGEQRGIQIGEQRGIQIGEQRGMEIGKLQGIRAMILDGLEDNLPKEKILLKLQRHFSLTESQAEQYYVQYR